VPLHESRWDDRDKNGSTNIGNIIDTRPMDILMRRNRASITDREEWRTWIRGDATGITNTEKEERKLENARDYVTLPSGIRLPD